MKKLRHCHPMYTGNSSPYYHQPSGIFRLAAIKLHASVEHHRWFWWLEGGDERKPSGRRCFSNTSHCAASAAIAVSLDHVVQPLPYICHAARPDQDRPSVKKITTHATSTFFGDVSQDLSKHDSHRRHRRNCRLSSRRSVVWMLHYGMHLRLRSTFIF